MSEILTNQELVSKLSKFSPFHPIRILVPESDAAVSVKGVVRMEDHLYIIPDNENAIIAPTGLSSEKLLEMLS